MKTIYDYKDAFDIANDQQTAQQEKLVCLKRYLQILKGYGEQTQELDFWRKFLKQVFDRYPDLRSFEWSQYQDYNDSYLYYDTDNFKINKHLSVSVYGFDDANKEWQPYHFDSELEEDLWRNFPDKTGEEPYKKHNEFLEKRYGKLRPSVDCILLLLQACYELYSPYYFIYLFGRRANVKITRQGIQIDTQNVDYLNFIGHDYTFDREYFEPENRPREILDEDDHYEPNALECAFVVLLGHFISQEIKEFDESWDEKIYQLRSQFSFSLAEALEMWERDKDNFLVNFILLVEATSAFRKKDFELEAKHLESFFAAKELLDLDNQTAINNLQEIFN